MSENDTNKEPSETKETTSEPVTEEFNLNPLSSAEFIKPESDEVIPDTKAPQFLVE